MASCYEFLLIWISKVPLLVSYSLFGWHLLQRDIPTVTPSSRIRQMPPMRGFSLDALGFVPRPMAKSWGRQPQGIARVRAF